MRWILRTNKYLYCTIKEKSTMISAKEHNPN
jgi:hypothetical protein